MTKKLVSYWSATLIKKPYLHDKVEFEITDGSFDASILKKVKKNYLFLSAKEQYDYINLLKKFTNKLIKNFKLDYNRLDKNLHHLENERLRFINSYLNNKNNLKKIIF